MGCMGLLEGAWGASKLVEGGMASPEGLVSVPPLCTTSCIGPLACKQSGGEHQTEVKIMTRNEARTTHALFHFLHLGKTRIEAKKCPSM